MEIKLFDSELKIMSILWDEGAISAKRVSEIAATQVGWSKTTTYTVIKKCIEKGAIERIDPNFICHAAVTKEQIQQYETRELINKLYDGETDKLIASFIGNDKLSKKELESLKKLISEME